MVSVDGRGSALGFSVAPAKFCMPDNISLFDKHLERRKKRPFYETVLVSHSTTRSDFIERVELLTARRIRHITSPS